MAFGAGAWDEGIQWSRDLDGALKVARQADKIVMVDFMTEWCGWCKRLDEDVYANEQVAKLAEKSFVAVKIDGDKRPDLVRRYQIRGYPTIVFLAPDGNKLKAVIGFRPPQLFIAEMKEAIELYDLYKQKPQLEKKIKAGQASADELVQLAHIYRRLGDNGQAYQLLVQARKAGCHSADFKLEWTLAKLRGGDRTASLRKWLDENRDHPRRAEAYYELGMAYAEVRAWEKAVSQFDQAAVLAPDSVWGIRAKFLADLIRDRYLNEEACSA